MICTYVTSPEDFDPTYPHTSQVNAKTKVISTGGRDDYEEKITTWDQNDKGQSDCHITLLQ